MARVLLSLPKLGVTNKGWERNKEVYVVSFASDLNVSDSPKLAEIIAANNETLPNVIPDIQQQAVMRFVLVSASNLFSRIRPDQPASLSGSGIILYPHLDPKGLLAAHFMIIESDAGTRNLGGMLAGLCSDDDVNSVVSSLIENFTQPLLAALLNTVVAKMPGLLQANKDDLLFAHSHSGFDFDRYGCDPDSTCTDFELGNDLAHCTLRVRITE